MQDMRARVAPALLARICARLFLHVARYNHRQIRRGSVARGEILQECLIAAVNDSITVRPRRHARAQRELTCDTCRRGRGQQRMREQICCSSRARALNGVTERYEVRERDVDMQAGGVHRCRAPVVMREFAKAQFCASAKTSYAPCARRLTRYVAETTASAR